MDSSSPLPSRRTLGYAASLFVLNALVCRELFVIPYTIHLGSIEAAYIGISRYAIEHPFEWDWFPLWYGGIPYHNTYPPLLHLVVAGVAWLFGLSPALAHHAITAVFYCLGPVAVYLLALEFSRKQWPSVLSGLAFSLFSPSISLLQQVESWAGSPWNPARLHALLDFGDGPHIAALTLMPIAVLALHYALERCRPGRVFLAAGVLAAVVLTNWLGAFSLAIAVLAYLLARASEPAWGKAVVWSAAIGGIAYALAAPWIPPSAIADIRYNAQYTIGSYPMTPRHLVYAVFVLVATVVVWRLNQRFRPSLILRFSIFLTLFFSALVLADDWLGIQLMPQPHRYYLELEMAISILGVFGAARLVGPLTRRTAGLAAGFTVFLALVQYVNYRNEARLLIQSIDITQSVEYQASEWLGEHFPRDRVFITGSTQFWLNAFVDTQQLGGGFGQGIVNRQIPTAHYGIPWTTGDGEAAATWLRLFGNQAVVVSSPEGRDFYKEAWRDPNKFNGILPELWRNGGDAIYGVPQRSRSLAHVILPEHVPYRSPVNNVDLGPVEPLAHALEDHSLPLASFEWATASDARISAQLSPEQLLFVQVTHHPGWRAFVDGEPRPIRKDALGFMIVEPRCEGACEVTLSFDGGLEMLLARMLCAFTILGGFAWAFLSRPSRLT